MHKGPAERNATQLLADLGTDQGYPSDKYSILALAWTYLR